MNEARDFAVKYLEDMLSFFGLNVAVRAETDEEAKVITLEVPSTHLNGFLIGQKGDNLRSIQHLANMALYRKLNQEGVTVTVDVAGYKKQQNERLAHHAEKIAKEVLDSGEPQSLNPMSAYDRRVVHKALGEIKGITTESEGEGRDRKVVIKKA